MPIIRLINLTDLPLETSRQSHQINKHLSCSVKRTALSFSNQLSLVWAEQSNVNYRKQLRSDKVWCRGNSGTYWQPFVKIFKSDLTLIKERAIDAGRAVAQAEFHQSSSREQEHRESIQSNDHSLLQIASQGEETAPEHTDMKQVHYTYTWKNNIREFRPKKKKEEDQQ